MNSSGNDIWSFFALDKVNLGPGVVGRTAVFALVSEVCLVFLTWALKDTEMVAWLVAATIALPFLFLAAAFLHAFVFPGHSMVEGAQALKLKLAELAVSDKQLTIGQTPGNVSPPPDLKRIEGRDA